MHPLKCEISIFQDSSTGSHEKTSQGVGIEKAVFTSSEHNNFIFHYRKETCRRRNAVQPDRPVHWELGYSRQAESTAPGIAGDRAFEVLYSNTLLAKAGKTCSNFSWRYLASSANIYMLTISACWDSVPNPLNSPCRDWLRVRKPNAK